MIRLIEVLFSTALLASASLFLVVPVKAGPQHRFLIEEYDQFHDVLHPLEHEALPSNDFRRIRSKASELVKIGKAIIKIGVPVGPPTAQKELAKELKKFDKALARFKRDAKSGTDDQLKVSYSAVHDSFELVASILPALYPSGSPPTVSLDCPATSLEAGKLITIAAFTPDAEFVFTWTVSAGKITNGQGTSSVTIDTTGIVGRAILVTVEAYDGTGFVVSAKCEVQMSSVP